MITSTQLRAARALLGIDQRKLAELSGLSVPTIQRMEASDGVIRGNVDSLMKLVDALDNAGIELIGAGAVSGGGGRGVRLKEAGAEAKPASVQGREGENVGVLSGAGGGVGGPGGVGEAGGGGGPGGEGDTIDVAGAADAGILRPSGSSA